MSIVSGTLFCSYGTVDSFFFQICVVDDLNGVHCSGEPKCFLHEDKFLTNISYVAPGLRTQECTRWTRSKRRSLEVSTSSSFSTSTPAPPTGVSPVLQNQIWFLSKVGDRGWTCGCKPCSWDGGRTSKNGWLAISNGRFEDRAEVQITWPLNLTHFHMTLTREEEVSVLWTIAQPCIEDYRITLCPLHQVERTMIIFIFFYEGIRERLLDRKLQSSKFEERRRLPRQDSTHQPQRLRLPLWRLQGLQKKF